MTSPAREDGEVAQAEAYFGDRCLLIRNEKTASVADWTATMLVDRVHQVPDFHAFMDECGPVVAGANVIVTLGDSVTANIHNWPYALASRHFSGTAEVVINLADWARSSEMNIPVLETVLEWLSVHRIRHADCLVLLGLRDIHQRIVQFDDFSSGATSSPISEMESRLARHAYGGELNRLGEAVPEDWDDAPRWIAERTAASVRMMDRVCEDAGAFFAAILHPSSYAEFSPNYSQAIERAYAAADTAAKADFEAWCHEHRYYASPSNFGPRDHRPFLEALRSLWRRQAARSRHGAFLDWSALFHDVEDLCFDDKFDAVHYNKHGTTLIADAVAVALSLPKPRSHLARATDRS